MNGDRGGGAAGLFLQQVRLREPFAVGWRVRVRWPGLPLGESDALIEWGEWERMVAAGDWDGRS